MRARKVKRRCAATCGPLLHAVGTARTTSRRLIEKKASAALGSGARKSERCALLLILPGSTVPFRAISYVLRLYSSGARLAKRARKTVENWIMLPSLRMTRVTLHFSRSSFLLTVGRYRRHRPHVARAHLPYGTLLGENWVLD